MTPVFWNPDRKVSSHVSLLHNTLECCMTHPPRGEAMVTDVVVWCDTGLRVYEQHCRIMWPLEQAAGVNKSAVRISPHLNLYRIITVAVTLSAAHGALF